MKCCFYCESPEVVEDCKHCHLASFCGLHGLQIHRRGNSCQPFKVVTHPEKGQCLVATRDIKPMELILQELPALVGPYAFAPKKQCLECFRLIKEADSKVVTATSLCKECGYPLCEACQKLDPEKSTHSRSECRLFREAGHRAEAGEVKNLLTPYVAIQTIRFLLLKERNPIAWQSLHTLRDHNEERRKFDPDLWRDHEESVASFLTTKMILPSVAAEDIFRLMGILKTNSANLDFPSDGSFGQGSGIYPTYSKINHSCICNTKVLNNLPGYQLQLRASTRIKAGEEITNQYVKPQAGSLARRWKIRSKWHFDCQCPRCSDPTELSSHLGTMLCPSGGREIRGCDGLLLPIDPLDSLSDWQCTNNVNDCEESRDVSYVSSAIRAAESRLKRPKDTDDVVMHYERFLYEQGQIFHSNHYLLNDVKMHLAVLYGNLRSYQLETMTRPQLERKIQCCKDVLETLGKVEYGYTSWRGKMLHELTRVTVFLAKRDFKSGKATKLQLQKALSEEQMLRAYIGFNHAAYFGKS